MPELRRRTPLPHSLRSLAALAGLGLLLSCGTASGPDTRSTPEPVRSSGAATAAPAAVAEPVPAHEAEAPLREGSDAEGCAPGTLCLKVDPDGTRNLQGSSVAQCTGTFPDYVVEASLFPANYGGPWFLAASDFPDSPDGGPHPWEEIDFMDGKAGADAYAYALRDYAFEGNIAIDFRVQENPIRTWVTVPYMNYGGGRRELVHGLTRERTVTGPELGLKAGVSIRNYAIGFYNGPGGYTIGQVWEDPWVPDLEAARAFPEAAMVFKILFSDAVPEDFADPGAYPLVGSPAWQIATGDGELTTVRLMQMDVAARDPRSQPTGWVYGTFAFDPEADDPVAWNRLRPVGVQWDNAPGYTPEDQQNGVPLPDNTLSELAPQYAKDHLGWAGRLNGPVDNPRSACMSCHGTAQYPVEAGMIPPSNCSQEEKLYWFRDLPSGEPFGDVDGCDPVSGPPAVALDTSLQLKVSVQSILQYRDVNPCLDPTDAPPAARLSEAAPGTRNDAPRVTRDGLDGE